MTTTTGIEKDLLEMEKRYWQAIKDRNIDAALAMTDDPCLIAGASGVATVGHDSFRTIMQSAKYTLHGFEIDPAVQVRQLGDVAILAYKVREDLTVDGEPVTLNAADTSVWARRDGVWRCALHTESVLGDSYGRDRKR